MQDTQHFFPIETIELATRIEDARPRHYQVASKLCNNLKDALTAIRLVPYKGNVLFIRAYKYCRATVLRHASMTRVVRMHLHHVPRASLGLPVEEQNE